MLKPILFLEEEEEEEEGAPLKPFLGPWDAANDASGMANAWK